MRKHLSAAWLLATLAALVACGSGASPDPAHVVTTDVTPPPLRSGSAAARTVPAPSADDGKLPMYPVGDIYGLIDLWRTDDGKIELRLGVDFGGGTLGHFRFVQLTGGKPDFETETTELHFADTTNMGRKLMVGSHPDLLYHSVSGFRSGPSDNAYFALRDGEWRVESVAGVDGISLSMDAWTKGRVLEARNSKPEIGVPIRVPDFRVVRGADKEAPSLPRALGTRLEGEDFLADGFIVLRSGEVVVVGKRKEPGTLGMLLWREQLKQPTYVVSTVPGITDDADVTILGGTSLTDLRIQADTRVLRFDGEGLVVESTMAADGLPDVWFGRPLVIDREKGAFVRLAAKSPWVSIPVTAPSDERSIVVDGAGVVWKAEQGTLSASVRPSGPRFDFTEEALVARRKGSVRLGGSWDATGEEPAAFTNSKCRMHFVLLDDSPQDKASADYPAHRAVLKGHTELAAAKLVVVRERGRQYFGAVIADYDTGRKIEDLIAKRVKGSTHDTMCAEPAGAAELRFDWATGKLTP